MIRNSLNKIEFFCVDKRVSDRYSPIPSVRILPEWYKKTYSYMDNAGKVPSTDMTVSTVKKCMPLFDAMSNGYFLLTYSDMYIEWDGISYSFIFPKSDIKSIAHHALKQAELYPMFSSDMTDLPKWINPWGIKTPKGYSCLILPPMHRDQDISILPGIVDTDSYNETIHLPFLINKKEQSFMIPAGTPIAQIIPFKRESWELEITNNTHYARESKRSIDSKFFDAYKSMFWSRKEYK